MESVILSSSSSNKTTNKINTNVRKALEQANLKALKIEGFVRFSYTAQWHDFPGSLKVSCHFTSNEAVQLMSSLEQEMVLIKIVQHSFLKQGIKFKDVRNNVVFTHLDVSDVKT
jgi:hypothetical protein